MQMAQIAERSAVFWAHTTSKVGVVQMLVARELRHILEHAQTLFNGLLPLGRQITPGWQYVIFNVIALLRRHLLPHPLTVAHILLLLRRQLPKALLILEHSLSLFGTEVLLIIFIGIVVILPTPRILPVS
jgi:hypothetical protein